ncbi:hypothetical protein [Psychromonas antarctica]|uniref:hypothetical protein n=1 Tax=Psychromonas antarctica TaxID=67573 RepID=UPI001EE937ED|nr:hypothetical protein [Psychromonas antarctica]MCG6201090.1 hypothetical protein [Psychromonas antarctica]
MALALSGCGGSDSVNTAPVNTVPANTDLVNTDPVNTDTIFKADEFVLISSSGATSDIDFSSGNTVGEWDTGSQISETTYDGLNAWTVTSAIKTAEQGNWGTVLVFQDGIVGDFSLFNTIKLKFATSGGYSQYKVAISANGMSKEVVLPVNDAISTWQEQSINLADFALNLSQIDYIAVMGVGGTPSVSKIYITDLQLEKESAIAIDTDTESDFVFKSSDAEVTSSLVVDDDNNSAVGNVIFGEWDTGTALASTTYHDLASWQLSAVAGWGAVLALQGDISDGLNIDNYDVDFSNYTNIKFKIASEGDFERYSLALASKTGTYEVTQEVGFTLLDQAEWNTIDINLDRYGVDLSKVSQIALFGVYKDGTPASQKIYITDFVAYDSGVINTVVKDSSDDKFVFISSSDEQVDIIVDDNNFVHDGNITINDWSTGTSFAADVVYDGLSAMELTKGAGWGAVLAMMGDIYGGVLTYDLDLTKYNTVNFKIAAAGNFTGYEIDFVTAAGAELKLPLTVNSNWTDVSFNLADLPLNLTKISQIAIYGIGGAAGDNIYITDFNITK